MNHCETCNAPKKYEQYWMRCGTCAIVNGKLPPTKYVPIKEKQ